MKFSVEVKEVLARVVCVEADTEDDALEKVRLQYRATDIVLDSSDFVDVKFNIASIDCPESEHANDEEGET